MRYRHSAGTIFAIVAASTLSVGTFTQALAENATEARPLELRKIMQVLGKNMQSVTDGISREDWALVAEIAPRIAKHPQPPIGEKIRILAFVGTDARKYKAIDKKTHLAARALEGAAARGDGNSVISTFADLQNSCLACHQSFRKPFVEHFYGQR